MLTLLSGDCLRGLLTRDAARRLGGGETGAVAIMQSSFFAPIDFDALYRKEIQPPFRPEVKNELDTRYVPRVYLEAKAVDSSENITGKKGSKKTVAELAAATEGGRFDAFTYAGGGGIGDA